MKNVSNYLLSIFHQNPIRGWILKPSENKGVPSMSYFYCFYYVIGWHFSHTSIYEGVNRKFISGPIAFKVWSNIFMHVDYLVICTFSMWHYINSGPYFSIFFFFFFLSLLASYLLFSFAWSESQLKKNAKSKKKWHTWATSSGLVLRPINCTWINTVAIIVWYLDSLKIQLETFRMVHLPY